MTRSLARLRSAAANSLLVFLSIGLFFLGLEALIRIHDAWASRGPAPTAHEVFDRFADVPPELVARAEARKAFLTMPEEWKRRDVTIPGSLRSYYWHGALHVHNADNMRHLGPYPPKQPGIFRIIVVRR
jgi:hypothetical protein